MTPDEQDTLKRIMRASLAKTRGQTVDRRLTEAATAGMHWCEEHDLKGPDVLCVHSPRGIVLREYTGAKALAFLVAELAQELLHNEAKLLPAHPILICRPRPARPGRSLLPFAC